MTHQREMYACGRHTASECCPRTDRGREGDGPVDVVADVRAFHEKFGIPVADQSRRLDPAVVRYRLGFLIEELTEVASGYGYTLETKLTDRVGEATEAYPDMARYQNEKPEEVADGLVDLVYVAVGTALMHGFPFNRIWRAVQAANMSKVRSTGCRFEASRADRARCVWCGLLEQTHSKRGSTLDVVKPEGWGPPDVKAILVENGLE